MIDAHDDRERAAQRAVAAAPPDAPRRILLVDADAFFVAVARMVDPEVAGKTTLLIVGGSADSRGVVCSASYETRKFGVRSAMPMSQAVRLCPQALVVPVPRRACSEKSREIRAVLERFAPVVQAASIDEWYLDLAGTEQLYGGEPLADTARRIRDAVMKETGLSISIGGGTSKVVAKMAVETAKPKPGTGATGVHVVPPGGERDFMAQFELREIPLVGPKFAERLERFGLVRVPDLFQYDLSTLARWLGEREAEWLWERAQGIDDGVVEEREEAKSMGREETFARDIADDASLEQELLRLASRVAGDLRGDGLCARTITVRLKDHDFTSRSAARTLDEPVESDRVIYAVARELLAKLRAKRRVPARLVGVSLSSLAPTGTAPPRQLSFFGEAPDRITETDRDRAVSRLMDVVRGRFGNDAIGPGLVRDED